MAVKYSGIRESRHNRYNDLISTGKQVEEDFKKGCLKKADRSFSQGLQCQEINSMSALSSMEDSVLIAHAPQGCVGCVEGMYADLYRVGQIHRGEKHIKNCKIMCTNLDKNSVIFGGEEKLRKSIAMAVERYHPKMIFVFSSCSAGIIGDDIDAILSDLQNEYEAVLVPIHCEGFKSKICASGYDAAFIAINKYIIKKEKQEKQENLINMFAPPTISYADQKEMERMLGLIGMEVNYIPFYSSLEKLRKIPAASASTAICKVFADEFMIELEQDYGIPYSHTVMPIGIRNTNKWFLETAKIVGKEKEAQEIIDRETKRVQPLVAQIRERLQGKRVFICGGTGRSFAAAALMEDFGMELVGLETPTYDQDAQDDIEYLNNIHKDFVVDIANMQPFEQVNLLKKLKPDAFIGVPLWAAKLGLPTTHVLDFKRPTMGYDGLLFLGNKIADQLENPGFNKKLAAHTKLPYRESWYEEDAFKYIIV